MYLKHSAFSSKRLLNLQTEEILRRSEERRDKCCGTKRSSIINVTSTNQNIGPTTYYDNRSSFPLYIDELLDKKVSNIQSRKRKLACKSMDDNEERKVEPEIEMPKDLGSTYIFKLPVSRKIQTAAPVCKLCPKENFQMQKAEEKMQKKKKIVKNKFFSCTMKSPIELQYMLVYI
jgi:hypothetical protein